MFFSQIRNKMGNPPLRRASVKHVPLPTWPWSPLMPHRGWPPTQPNQFPKGPASYGQSPGGSSQTTLDSDADAPTLCLLQEPKGQTAAVATLGRAVRVLLATTDTCVAGAQGCGPTAGRPHTALRDPRGPRMGVSRVTALNTTGPARPLRMLHPAGNFPRGVHGKRKQEAERKAPLPRAHGDACRPRTVAVPSREGREAGLHTASSRTRGAVFLKKETCESVNVVCCFRAKGQIHALQRPSEP